MTWEITMSKSNAREVVESLGKFGISRVHLTHLPSSLPPTAASTLICRGIPGCVVSTTVALARFAATHDATSSLAALSSNHRIVPELLVVSGDQHNAIMNSVDAIRMLRGFENSRPCPRIAVAYTCESEIGKCTAERDKLRRKFDAAGQLGISRIILQICDDAELLRRETVWIRELAAERRCAVAVSGCILFPSRSLLFSLAAKPWPGVSFKQSAFLSSLSDAQQSNEVLWGVFERECIDPYLIMLPFPMASHEGWQTVPRALLEEPANVQLQCLDKAQSRPP
jgi:hypothetical protein